MYAVGGFGMANARKPDSLHLLQGTFQPCRHGNPEDKPQIESMTPEIPAWLPAQAKREWRRVSKILSAAGLLTLADESVLARYCALYAELQVSLDEFPSSKHAQIRACENDLGMSPAARSKITIGSKKKANDFDDV